MKPGVRQLLLGGSPRYSPGAPPVLGLTVANGVALPSDFTFTVGGVGGSRYFFDSTGTYRVATAQEVRHCYDAAVIGGAGAYQGVLLEPYSTNTIRNGSGTGASGTTLPTNWTDNSASIALSLVAASSSTENGVAYTQLRYTGTPTGTALNILHDASGAITSYTDSAGGTTAVAAAQKWTASARTKIISNTGVSAIDIGLVEVGSGVTTYGRLPREATYRKGHASATLAASVTSVYAQTRMTVAVGVAVDITIRIAHVQLEPLGYSSSYIPTTSAAATRASDTITATAAALARAFPRNRQGTFYFEHIEPYQITDGTQRTMLRFLNSTSNGRMSLEATNNNVQLILTNWNGVGTTTEAICQTNNPLHGRIVKTAVRFGPNDIAIVRDNLRPVTDTAALVFTTNDPATLTFAVDKPIIFRQFAMYRGKATNAQLQALSKNFDNFTFYDEFSRPDSATLGTAPGGSAWVQYGVGVRPGVVNASISNSYLTTQDKPAEADTASYNGIDLTVTPKRMAVLFRIIPNPSPSGSPLDCTVTLVSTAGGHTVQAILDNSLHWGISGQAVLNGYFVAGAQTRQDVSFSAVVADGSTLYYGGWEILDGEMWFEQPNGQTIKTSSPEAYESHAGRFITFEPFWTSGQHYTSIKAALAA